jgi:hypothetical protein
VHVEDIHHLLLRLTPPLAEREDSSIGCEVRLPDDSEAEASQYIAWPLPGKTESNVVPPQRVKAEGKWKTSTTSCFPTHSAYSEEPSTLIGSIRAYIVTWSRDHDFGRQRLRRCTFTIDLHGSFSEP